mgnify:CR=1 FL=1
MCIRDRNTGAERTLYPDYDSFIFHCDNNPAQLFIARKESVAPGEIFWGFALCPNQLTSTSVDASLFQVYSESPLDKKEATETITLSQTELSPVIKATYSLNDRKLYINIEQISPDIFVAKLVDKSNETNIIKSAYVENGINTLVIEDIDINTLNSAKLQVIIKKGDQFTQQVVDIAYDYFQVEGISNPLISPHWKDLDQDGIPDIYVVQYSKTRTFYSASSINLRIRVGIDDDLIIKITDEDQGYNYLKRIYSTDTEGEELINDGRVYLKFDKPGASTETVIDFNASIINSKGLLELSIKGTHSSELRVILNYTIMDPLAIEIPLSMLVIPGKSKSFSMKIHPLNEFILRIKASFSNNKMEMGLQFHILTKCMENSYNTSTN